jgi:hypothetical protein
MSVTLPWTVPVERVVARAGLISDTHMPERCAAFPASLFDVFRDVDLILHAGDLGELWVLERLSGIAPVVAVLCLFQSPIVEPDLRESIHELSRQTYTNLEALKPAILPLVSPCWTGEKRYVTGEELLHAIENSDSVAPRDGDKVIAILRERATKS